MPQKSTAASLNNALTHFANEQLITIEKEINALIERKEKDRQIIGCLLDVVSTLVEIGIGKEAHDRLFQYYVHVSLDDK